MTQRARLRFAGTALALATALVLPQATASLAAQSETFDLRPRAAPTPTPTPVVGPVDPDNPVVVARPRAETPAPQPRAAPPLEVPTFTPASPTASAPPRRTASDAAPQPRALPGARAATGPQAAPEQQAPTGQAPSVAPAARPAPAPYVARDLDAVRGANTSWTWVLLAALLALLGTGGWLAWSRHFRLRQRALPAPEIERPRLPTAVPAAPPAQAPSPAPAPATAAPLELTLQATRMSATLVNTTLSYRLAVTNNGAEPLHDVGIAGDMIAAHASRPVEELLGPAGTPLPELHRIATLAPGESVQLGGDIRLPLVAITPIRKGNAALFVPLARLRARGTDSGGAAVEGGGTFLVGQPGAAGTPANGARLQPFRLDLGPRNYSRLGQQRLPSHA